MLSLFALLFVVFYSSHVILLNNITQARYALKGRKRKKDEQKERGRERGKKEGRKQGSKRNVLINTPCLIS